MLVGKALHPFIKIFQLKCAKSLYLSQVAHQAGAYPGFCSIKWLEVFLLTLDGMLVHHWVNLAFNLLVPSLQRLHEKVTLA